MAFRNERTLHKRSCDLCQKSVISAYSAEATFPVYCSECWWSDKWDPFEYGREYDFNKSFFQQFKELQDKVPRQHTNNTSPATLINSEYTNCAGDSKNCYLMFGAGWNEDILYAHYTNHSKNCVDTLYCLNSELCYECFDVDQCYNVRFSQTCLWCRDSMFLFDCRNCSDCIGCVGLRNKKYHIFNKPYTKSEYLKEKEKLQLHTRPGLERFRKEFEDNLYLKLPRKYYHGQMNRNVSGDYISNSDNTQGFYTKNAKDSKYLFWCINAKDVYDYFAWGDLELCYECVSGGYNMYFCKFVHTAWGDLRNVEYCSLCFTSSDILGCIGLRSKQYCILNKKYSKAEYEKLLSQIKKHMAEMPYRDRRGMLYAYGENFPIELSPFPYTDTVAQEHFPLTKSEIQKAGYIWHEPVQRNYVITKKHAELPDSITEVSESILDDVTSCEHEGTCNEQCTFGFKIVPQELQFYQKINVPLPKLCHNCRHSGRVKQRNPLKLWHRKCTCAGQTSANGIYQNTVQHFHGQEPCPNEFQTSYAPQRPEIVYCERCYQAEVV